MDVGEELVVQSSSQRQSTHGAPGMLALSKERLLSTHRAVLITLKHVRV